MRTNVRIVGRNVMEVFRTVAKEDTNEEQCGLLFGFKKRSGGRDLYLLYDAVPMPNRSETPEDTFIISGRDARKAIVAAKRQGVRPVGNYHTHPPKFIAPPSSQDIEQLGHGNIGAVIGIRDRVVTFYDDADYEDRIDLFDD